LLKNSEKKGAKAGSLLLKDKNYINLALTCSLYEQPRPATALTLLFF